MQIIKQKDAMDCGPSCLAMIVKHFGYDPNIDQIRHNCALGKNGVSLLGLSKSAELIGIKTLSGFISLDSLIAEAPLPCIAHWDQNHFVVIYKVRKHRKGSGSGERSSHIQ